jgi:DNA invertase Pin-like site-specific DNA recombinase
MSARRIRCAIYTRKSTEEGLDQAFNSLDAQREACAAYIMSQTGEGWTCLPSLYDDGGYSGGSMERPGLRQLLLDIDAGLIDVVVVYKIDRLTRSLADFARIVERFEARGASFVSVTQAFNTTTSIGRLTLNVLLSFAQFEREVGAERVRDKVAASRKKGIFMGGPAPLGYDAKDRKLVINEAEAETIRFIFNRYLETSIGRVIEELEAKGITTKAYVSRAGLKKGGGRWFIGPLRHILRNRVYVGDAVHKENVYPGEHKPILDRALFDSVQAKMTANAVTIRRTRTIGSRSLLPGLIFDDRGNAMTPQRTSLQAGKPRYRFYVSQAILQHRRNAGGSLMRVSALPAEDFVLRHITQIAELSGNKSIWESADPETDQKVLLRRWLQRFVVSETSATLTINTKALADDGKLSGSELTERLQTVFPAPVEITALEPDAVCITIPARLKIRSGAHRREPWDAGCWTSAKSYIDRSLLSALARANRWRRMLEVGEVNTIDQIARLDGMERRHVQKTLRLAFLAPDLQQMIVSGRQPPTVQLTALLETDLPLLWADQRAALGL